MSKKKARNSGGNGGSELPYVPPENDTPEYVSTAPPVEEKPEVTVTRTVTASVLTCSVPYIDGAPGYCSRRIDTMMNGSQAKKLKGILVGIQEKGGRLANGRIVTTPSHALLYMIENAE